MKNNFLFYENLIKGIDFCLNGHSFSKHQNFWDLIVITSINQKQRKCYELQLEIKKNQGKIPKSFKFLVIDDPNGCKIGSGGSTLNVVKELFQLYSQKLYDMKILLIHAGGYSQRIPFRSILGKLFGLLPSESEYINDIFDFKLACFTPFAKDMDPGIFITSSDDIETFILEEQIEASKLFSVFDQDFILLAHKSSLNTAKDHGVYKIDFNVDSCENEPNFGCFSCQSVYQKPSIEKIRNLKMAFNDGISEYAFTDSVFFFSHKVSRELLEFHDQHFKKIIQLKIEIDIYRDFLQPLGDNKQELDQYLSTIKINNGQELDVFTKIYELMNEKPAKILFFKESKFFHLGTIDEMMEYYFDCTSKDAINFREEICFKKNIAEIKKRYLVRSKIGPKCVLNENVIIELSYFDESVEIVIGKNSLISNCMFKLNDFTGETKNIKISVPSDIYLHTVPIIDGVSDKRKFVTIFFKRNDDLKKTYASFESLKILGKNLGKIASHVLCSGEYSIWNFKFFKSFDTMSDSFLHSCNFINDYLDSNFENIHIYFQDDKKKFISLFDLLEQNDFEYMLQFRLDIGL
ncbi:fucose-1-phosphate guanylyltransferase [Brachionus plicatilis]|uniref:Fucose-1-phosphate guanylyltransferase n=1 Tax=Brachionus plicatilis TaxID=10195 RepID=A0A3M7RUT8_BRAPC|nr:fucose-1-phosphate guanylyltransferase [Brachionus plicatilis]